MRRLPDNPDMSHLRRQAKDLLAGLKDSDPDLTLATAQASLAGQYGFASWTELKAEVDRRQGDAAIADPGLASEIAHRYGLGRVTAPMRSMAPPDDMGRQWALRTDLGRWAVRTMDSWIPIVDAESDVALQQAAAEAGVALPSAVRSRDGRIIESVGGHDWRVYEWQHSGPPLVAPVPAAVACRIGEILATVHGLRLPVDRISPWHAWLLGDTPWSELVAAAREQDRDWAHDLRHLVPALGELARVGHEATPAAPVLCHNTLGPANVRFGGAGRLIVFDWEHAGGQPPAWELGDALTHWAVNPDGTVNAAGVRAMLSGYESVAGQLPPLELAMFAGAATSLGNHLFEEVTTALRASPDTGDDANRSVRHLLAQLPSRTTFERLLASALRVARG